MSARPFAVGGRLAAPWVPHSPCGTPGRATCPGEVGSPTPTSPDCIHPFERRLRLCDPEVATAISSWELTVGSSRKEKHVATRALTAAARSGLWYHYGDPRGARGLPQVLVERHQGNSFTQGKF